MIFPYPTEWPQFFTVSIINQLPLLATDKYKTIITDRLRFLVKNKRIELNAFVMMDNHIHTIWQPLPGHTLSSIQLSFMKFALAMDNPHLLEQFKVDKKDREYQIWKRKSLSI